MENFGEHDDSYLASLFRVRVVVLGPSQSGKTSLVQCLLQGKPTTGVIPTEGVNVEYWAPFHTDGQQAPALGRSLTEEEKSLVFELWDTTGRQICQSVHGLFISPGTICVIVYDVTDGTAAERVLSFYKMVQQRCVGSPVVIVGNKQDLLDSSSTTGELHSRDAITRGCQKYNEALVQKIQNEIDDIKTLYKDSSPKETDNDHSQQRPTTRKDSKATKASEDPVEAMYHTHVSELDKILKRCGRNASLSFLAVSAASGKGVEELRKTLLETALNFNLYPDRQRSLRPSTLTLFEHILAMRDQDLVMLPWQRFREEVSEGRGADKEGLEEEIRYLESVGAVMDIRLGKVAFPKQTSQPAEDSNNRPKDGEKGKKETHTERGKPALHKQETEKEKSRRQSNVVHGKSDDIRYICVNPAALASAVFYCLIDDDKKAFRFEAGRFWPRDSGFKHPDPQTLCRVLEAIPQEGLLREGLLPLLWQEYPLTEDQVLSVLEVLQGVGLLVLHSEQKKHCEGMALPAFPKLSVKRCYALPLLNLLPDNRPQLNWTAKPFAGDMQITWCFNMAVPVHAGLLQRLLGVIVFLAKDCSSYTHYWKTGVLLRVGEATVCAEQQGEARVELACRVNGDEEGREQEATRMLWVTLAPFVYHVRHFLLAWPGVTVRETAIALGQQFYMEEKVEREPELWMCRLLALWHRQTRFSFTEGDAERELDVRMMMPFKPDATVVSSDTWLQFVITHTESALKEATHHLDNHDLPSVVTAPKDGLVRGPNRASLKNGLTAKGSLKLQRKKKNAEVKWQLQEDNNNNTTTTTTTSTKPPANTVAGNGDIQQNKSSATAAPAADTDGAKDEATKITRKGRVVSEEEEIAEANRLASGFVAAILATAVADYIAQEAEGDQDGRKMVSAAQITAARVTAEAALAVQTGDIDRAANAVIDAVNSVHSNSVTKSEVKIFSDGRPRSKFCVIL